MPWSRKHISCTSCGTEEWVHKGNGHCAKCYPLIKKKEIIKQWDKNNEMTLVPISPIDKKDFRRLIKMGKLDKAKESLIKQIEARIDLYQKYNSPNCNSLAIEYLLERIARITNNVSNEKLFHGAVDRYRNNFTDEQRRVIYRDLIFILIHRKFNLKVWADII